MFLSGIDVSFPPPHLSKSIENICLSEYLKKVRIYVDIGIGKRMKAKSGLAENHFADTKGGPA